MRVGTQLLVIAVMAGLGGGGWYYWQSQAVGKVATATAGAPRAAAIVVDVVRAERGLVEERVESVGTARANEAVTITAKLTGIVSAIGFREGQVVQAGDLLTFATRGSRVSHVGLYIGNGRFIHSATAGVQISVLSPDDISGRWWYRRWVGVRRLV